MYTHLELRDSTRPPVTLATLDKMKREGEKIASITCYDASFAVLVDAADADVVLVGDSLGMVLQGHDTTVPVTMDDMVYHCRATARGIHRPFLMADLPFGSYPTKETALANSVRLMQEGGAEMVKLESGGTQIEIVEFLARHDIAVCAHLGLKPQSVHKTGGFRVQGRGDDAGQRMIDSAKALESAGADIVLLECIPSELGKRITEELAVPVIGIGALRRAQYHNGSQAALRQEFHGRCEVKSRCRQSLCAGGEGQVVSGARALLLAHANGDAYSRGARAC
jgi:3-methyl-2-oxobutanoate hydroxymethyltransferase